MSNSKIEFHKLLWSLVRKRLAFGFEMGFISWRKMSYNTFLKVAITMTSSVHFGGLMENAKRIQLG
jgi:hypothetical protein